MQPDILAVVAEKNFKLDRGEWLGFLEAAEDVVYRFPGKKNTKITKTLSLIFKK